MANKLDSKDQDDDLLVEHLRKYFEGKMATEEKAQPPKRPTAGTPVYPTIR